MKSSWRAWQYFQPDAPRISLVGLLLLISTGANLLKPWPLAIIVDSVLGGKPAPGWLKYWTGELPSGGLLLVLTGATLLLHLGQGMLSSAQNFLAIQVGLRGLQRVRNEMFSRLQHLSMRFCQGATTGDLIYRASWDTYSFQTLFQQGLVTSVTALLSLILMLVVMWRLDVGLTFAVVATVPLVLLAIQFFGRRMRERGVTAQQADSQITATIQQTLAALPLIQSYTRETAGEAVFARQTETARERRLSQHGWELLYWLAISLAFSVGTAAIVWLGSRRVQAGRLTVGELLIFLAYLAQLYEPLNLLSHVGATVSTASAGTQRVFEILDAKDEIVEAPRARAVVGTMRGPPKGGTTIRDAETSVVARGNLRFEGVSFSYQIGQRVLDEVSFTAAAGDVVAIIGPSGVGKTTLLNLLPRFHDPTTGKILLEGVDLRKLRLKDLRRQIALVTQEGILLAGTVAENIAFGKPDATAEEIQAAAQAAQADGFIQKLPQGYQTPLGDGAARLSVGEKQRLSLARAFLKDAPILLLDEPTSALDAESEALVVAGLEKLMLGRTTFIVAHRMSTVRRANRFLALKDGKLREIAREEALTGRMRNGRESTTPDELSHQ